MVASWPCSSTASQVSTSALARLRQRPASSRSGASVIARRRSLPVGRRLQFQADLIGHEIGKHRFSQLYEMPGAVAVDRVWYVVEQRDGRNNASGLQHFDALLDQGETERHAARNVMGLRKNQDLLLGLGEHLFRIVGIWKHDVQVG